MPKTRLALAVIGDEIGPSLPEMLSFCREHDVHRLDMRTVDGRNLLGMTLAEIRPLARTLKAAGIGVPTFVALAPMVDLIHLKDRDFAAKRTVPVGDGGVPWARELTRLLSHATAPEIVASMETHCPADGRNATAKSVAALRRIADEIGAEIV